MHLRTPTRGQSLPSVSSAFAPVGVGACSLRRRLSPRRRSLPSAQVVAPVGARSLRRRLSHPWAFAPVDARTRGHSLPLRRSHPEARFSSGRSHPSGAPPVGVRTCRFSLLSHPLASALASFGAGCRTRGRSLPSTVAPVSVLTRGRSLPWVPSPPVDARTRGRSLPRRRSHSEARCRRLSLLSHPWARRYLRALHPWACFSRRRLLPSA